MLVANKAAFDGVEITVNEKSDGAYVTHGDITVFVPAEAKNLSGAKLILDGKIAYVYKFLRNSGELPALDKTPEVFPVADNPRVVLPTEVTDPTDKITTAMLSTTTLATCTCLCVVAMRQSCVGCM